MNRKTEKQPRRNMLTIVTYGEKTTATLKGEQCNPGSAMRSLTLYLPKARYF